MKKISTAAAKRTRNFQSQKLTIGMDLGDRCSWYCVLNGAGEVVLEQKLAPFSLIVVALCAMQNSSHLVSTTDIKKGPIVPFVFSRKVY